MSLIEKKIAEKITFRHIEEYTKDPSIWVTYIRDLNDEDFFIYKYMYDHDLEILHKEKKIYNSLSKEKKIRFNKVFFGLYKIDFKIKDLIYDDFEWEEICV